MLLGLALPALAAPQSDVAVRTALDAASRGQLASAREAGLASHPLAGWIDYAALTRNLDALANARANDFLARYKDDPVGAGAAVGMDRALAALERFEANGNTVRHRLGMQESVLTQAGGMMGRITELTVQANGGALSDADRKAIAIEVTSLRDGLLDLANSTDGTGRYLFGGTQDGSAPFARTGTGIVYAGDQTQRQVEIAPQMFVADTLPGL